TQIAAFALALAAWKYPGEDGNALGYRPLPPLNIACSGQGVVGSKEDWVRFANGDSRFPEGMERLYDLFQKAPTLGSLIDPHTAAAYPLAKPDLATSFVERCIDYCTEKGTIAIVSPQNWWMLHSYCDFRKKLLQTIRLSILSSLGREAFDSFGSRGPMTTLLVA